MNKKRCKACGYITTEDFKICPLCGVPETAFEDYKDPVSNRRSKLLRLHIHPILLHFPQAITSMIAALCLFIFIIPESYKTVILNSIFVLNIFLAPSVFASYLSGAFDAKIRFKKLTTPYVRRKLITGIVLFIISLSLGAYIILYSQSQWNITIILILSVAGVISNIILGTTGSQLQEGILPGD